MFGDSAARRRWARLALSGIAVLVASVATRADSVGGMTIPAFGSGRIAIAKSGIRPIPIVPNLKFEFDGDTAAEGGTGTMTAYNEEGRLPIGEVPFEWTAGRRGGFVLAMEPEAFGDLVETMVASATGDPAEATIEACSCKGSLRDGGTKVGISIGASGLASLDGGTAQRLRVRMRFR